MVPIMTVKMLIQVPLVLLQRSRGMVGEGEMERKQKSKFEKSETSDALS